MSLSSPQLLAVIAGTQAISTVGETYSSIQAQKAQAIYEENIYNENARVANFQAEEVVSAGEREIGRLSRRTERLKGTQRAGFAGQGVEVDTGTPGDIQSETSVITLGEATKIRNDALMRAYGFRTEAIQSRSRARRAGQRARFGTRTTLLTGGLRAVTQGSTAIFLSRSGQFKPNNATEKRFDNAGGNPVFRNTRRP